MKNLGCSTREAPSPARLHMKIAQLLGSASHCHHPVRTTEMEQSIYCGRNNAHLGPDTMLSLLSDPLHLGNPCFMD